MKYLVGFVLGFCILGTGCGDDDDAKTDLNEDLITVTQGDTDVIANANSFPNFAHTCWTNSEGTVIGFWSTTDRITIIVYNDWACPGSTREQPMEVLTGNPRSVVYTN